MGSLSKTEFNNIVQTVKTRADSGDIEACKELGDLYYQGYSGNDENHQRAYPYWKKAADAGNEEAAGLIGFRLYLGDYGEDRESEAIPYLIAAADADVMSPGIQYLLGSAYESGIGCKKNLTLAKKYYRMAALRNHAGAQFRLGALIALDKNDESDWLHWLCCAHLNGNDDATETLNSLIKSPKDKQMIDWTIEKIQTNGIVPEVESRSSSDGGCYIATAVYGSYNASEVMILRRFRDEVLMEHRLGRLFVKTYYAVSPLLANKLKNARVLNSVVKSQLDLFVQYLRKKHNRF